MATAVGSPVAMTAQRRTGLSPGVLARWAAGVMVLEGVLSVRGNLRIPGEFIVTNDATATAANILANESLYRAGITLSLLAVAAHVAALVLFYELFKAASPTIARHAAWARLVAIGVQAMSAVFQSAPLKILHGSEFSSGFAQEQLDALAYWALQMQGVTFNIYMVLFGVSLIWLGYLIYISGFVPRFIGVLEMVAGAAYLILLWPPLATAWHPYYLFFGLGELVLLLWLLVKGVDSARWHAAARASRYAGEGSP